MARTELASLAAQPASVLDAETVEELAHSMEMRLRELDATHMFYQHLAPFGASDHDQPVKVCYFGDDEDAVARFDAVHNSNAPFARIMPQRAWPIRVDQMGGGESFSGPELAALYFLTGNARDHAVAVPIFGPRLRTGYAMVRFNNPVSGPDDVRVEAARAILTRCHLQYSHLIFDDAPEFVRLSAREHSILVQMARGRSNADIARCREISEHTVDTYVRRVFSKLKVNDRVSATLRGLAVGELDPALSDD